MANDLDPILTCLLSSCLSSFWSAWPNHFPIFIKLLVFFLLICRSFLHLLVKMFDRYIFLINLFQPIAWLFSVVSYNTHTHTHTHTYIHTQYLVYAFHKIIKPTYQSCKRLGFMSYLTNIHFLNFYSCFSFLSLKSLIITPKSILKEFLGNTFPPSKPSI